MIDNEYHVVTFDPGSAATGWTWFVVDFHAFSRPENKWLDWIKSWDCGEFRGTEFQIKNQCVGLVQEVANYGSYLNTDVVGEDFDLTQLIGGKNLLSPVRINSVIEWECERRAIKFHLQNRALRTNVTRGRLTAWGFEGKFRKDEFAAMQHGIVWIRRTKQQSRERPWKLMQGGVHNRLWDCSCGPKGAYKCDLVHPKHR